MPGAASRAEAKVRPARPGSRPARARSTNGLRRRRASEISGMITAPTIPPISMAPPATPACAVEKPRGPVISSIQVVTPLNMPRPTKKMTRRRMKSFCFIMLFRPSNIRDLTSWSAGPAGVGRLLPDDDDEEHRGNRGGDPRDHEHRLHAVGVQEERGDDQAREDPEVDGQRAEPRGRGPLIPEEPARGELGDCTQDQRLADGNPDL